MAEKISTEAKTKYNSSLRKTTSMGSKITKKNFSVSMVNTRSVTENRAKEDVATGNYKQIHPQERTTWTYRKYEEVKNLKELQFRGNHSGNYHATQMSEQIWCQKMI